MNYPGPSESTMIPLSCFVTEFSHHLSPSQHTVSETLTPFALIVLLIKFFHVFRTLEKNTYLYVLFFHSLFII